MDFWQYDVREGYAVAPTQVFPSACVVVRFNISAEAVEPIVYGPSLRSDMKSVFRSGVSAFGFALKVGWAAPLLRQPIQSLVDRRLSLGDFFGADLRILCERLAESPSFEARGLVSCEFLRRQLFGRVRLGAVSRFRAEPSGDLLGELGRLGARAREPLDARQPGITSRTLRRYFDQDVGLAPTQVARVMRVQQSMRDIRETAGRPALGAVAQRAGFSDQPHLNREFRRLMGMTPADFARYLGRFDRLELPIWTGIRGL